VHRAQMVPLPEGATFVEGASFLLTFLTAYIPLTRQVRLRPGSTVLVYAAAGGVGTAAIQVARALGARVVAAAGSAEKLDLCRELGAEEAYVYDELPDETRVDVVLDPVGGELFAGSFARLNPLGSVVAMRSTGEADMAALSDEQYRRALGANVDGVVFGIRELAARLMPDGGSIVATASLAGLTATPMDPVYALTKHAVVGLVRSVAPQLAERGIRINALCPGFTDTPI